MRVKLGDVDSYVPGEVRTTEKDEADADEYRSI